MIVCICCQWYACLCIEIFIDIAKLPALTLLLRGSYIYIQRSFLIYIYICSSVVNKLYIHAAILYQLWKEPGSQLATSPLDNGSGQPEPKPGDGDAARPAHLRTRKEFCAHCVRSVSALYYAFSFAHG